MTFSGVTDVAALTLFAQEAGTIYAARHEAASETLVAQQRTRILWSLALAAMLLLAAIAFSLRSRSRVLRVLAPMALTTLIVLAILRGTGVQ